MLLFAPPAFHALAVTQQISAPYIWSTQSAETPVADPPRPPLDRVTCAAAVLGCVPGYGLIPALYALVRWSKYRFMKRQPLLLFVALFLQAGALLFFFGAIAAKNARTERSPVGPVVGLVAVLFVAGVSLRIWWQCRKAPRKP